MSGDIYKEISSTCSPMSSEHPLCIAITKPKHIKARKVYLGIGRKCNIWCTATDLRILVSYQNTFRVDVYNECAMDENVLDLVTKNCKCSGGLMTEEKERSKVGGSPEYIVMGRR